MFVLTVRGSYAEWYVDDPTRGAHGPFRTEGEALRVAVHRAPALGEGTAVLQLANGKVWREFWRVGSPPPKFSD